MRFASVSQETPNVCAIIFLGNRITSVYVIRKKDVIPEIDNVNVFHKVPSNVQR